MKQFGKILRFELRGYLKNKIFVGITLFLVIAIAALMFVPNIIDAVKSDDRPSDEKLPTMLVKSLDPSLDDLAERCFSDVFADYHVQVFTGTIDELCDKVTSGEIECAFVLESATTYTYYVNNLSMYDTNAALADSALQSVYRMSAMIEGGLSPEAAGEILSVQINSRTETLGKDQVNNFFYTYIMIFALYMVILLYGQMVATNVATEKSSRAMEVLITSAKPTSMMFGKVLASCLAGFAQLVLVFGSAILFYNLNREQWSDIPIIASIFDMPPELLGYMLIFFVLGFLIYAFLFGAVGSTASKLEDINTSVMPITLLFVFGFIVVMIALSSGEVDTPLMKICSYVPFTSPMAMFTRIAMSTVAWYEIMASVVILIASAVGVGVLSAKIYRAGVLMYGTPPKLIALIKSIWKA